MSNQRELVLFKIKIAECRGVNIGLAPNKAEIKSKKD